MINNIFYNEKGKTFEEVMDSFLLQILDDIYPIILEKYV